MTIIVTTLTAGFAVVAWRLLTWYQQDRAMPTLPDWSPGELAKARIGMIGGRHRVHGERAADIISDAHDHQPRHDLFGTPPSVTPVLATLTPVERARMLAEQAEQKAVAERGNGIGGERRIGNYVRQRGTTSLTSRQWRRLVKKRYRAVGAWVNDCLSELPNAN